MEYKWQVRPSAIPGWQVVYVRVDEPCPCDYCTKLGKAHVVYAGISSLAEPTDLFDTWEAADHALRARTRDYSKPATREFLEELRERARIYGWSGDYVEIRDFVRDLYFYAGLEISDEELEPYPAEEDDDSASLTRTGEK